MAQRVGEDAKQSIPDHLACTLCGSRVSTIQCTLCFNRSFCLTCNDSYHQHPKRQAHLQRPVPPPRQKTGSRSSLLCPPTPPTRKKSRSASSLLLAVRSGGSSALSPTPPPRKKKRSYGSGIEDFSRSQTQSPALPRKHPSLLGRVERPLSTGVPLGLANRGLESLSKACSMPAVTTSSPTPLPVLKSRPPAIPPRFRAPRHTPPPLTDHPQKQETGVQSASEAELTAARGYSLPRTWYTSPTHPFPHHPFAAPDPLLATSHSLAHLNCPQCLASHWATAQNRQQLSSKESLNAPSSREGSRAESFSPRPMSEYSDDDDENFLPADTGKAWACRHCTYINDAGAKICEVCCKTHTVARRRRRRHPRPRGTVEVRGQSTASDLTSDREEAEEEATPERERPLAKPAIVRKDDQMEEEGEQQVSRPPTPEIAGMATTEVARKGPAQAPTDSTPLRVPSLENRDELLVWAQQSGFLQKSLSHTDLESVTKPDKKIEAAASSLRRHQSFEELFERTKPPGIEILDMVRRAGDRGYTLDEVEVALAQCGSVGMEPLDWLDRYWATVVEMVASMVADHTGPGACRASLAEAREALFQTKGEVLPALAHCLQHRRNKAEKMLENLDATVSEDRVFQALTAHGGDASQALQFLGEEGRDGPEREQRSPVPRPPALQIFARKAASQPGDKEGPENVKICIYGPEQPDMTEIPPPDVQEIEDEEALKMPLSFSTQGVEDKSFEDLSSQVDIPQQDLSLSDYEEANLREDVPRLVQIEEVPEEVAQSALIKEANHLKTIHYASTKDLLPLESQKAEIKQEACDTITKPPLDETADGLTEEDGSPLHKSDVEPREAHSDKPKVQGGPLELPPRFNNSESIELLKSRDVESGKDMITASQSGNLQASEKMERIIDLTQTFQTQRRSLNGMPTEEESDVSNLHKQDTMMDLSQIEAPQGPPAVMNESMANRETAFEASNDAKTTRETPSELRLAKKLSDHEQTSHFGSLGGAVKEPPLAKEKEETLPKDKRDGLEFEISNLLNLETAAQPIFEEPLSEALPSEFDIDYHIFAEAMERNFYDSLMKTHLSHLPILEADENNNEEEQSGVTDTFKDEDYLAVPLQAKIASDKDKEQDEKYHDTEREGGINQVAITPLSQEVTKDVLSPAERGKPNETGDVSLTRDVDTLNTILQKDSPIIQLETPHMMDPFEKEIHDEESREDIKQSLTHPEIKENEDETKETEATLDDEVDPRIFAEAMERYCYESVMTTKMESLQKVEEEEKTLKEEPPKDEGPGEEKRLKSIQLEVLKQLSDVVLLPGSSTFIPEDVNVYTDIMQKEIERIILERLSLTEEEESPENKHIIKEACQEILESEVERQVYEKVTGEKTEVGAPDIHKMSPEEYKEALFLEVEKFIYEKLQLIEEEEDDLRSLSTLQNDIAEDDTETICEEEREVLSATLEKEILDGTIADDANDEAAAFMEAIKRRIYENWVLTEELTSPSDMGEPDEEYDSALTGETDHYSTAEETLHSRSSPDTSTAEAWHTPQGASETDSDIWCSPRRLSTEFTGEESIPTTSKRKASTENLEKQESGKEKHQDFTREDKKTVMYEQSKEPKPPDITPRKKRTTEIQENKHQNGYKESEEPLPLQRTKRRGQGSDEQSKSVEKSNTTFPEVIIPPQIIPGTSDEIDTQIGILPDKPIGIISTKPAVTPVKTKEANGQIIEVHSVDLDSEHTLDLRTLITQRSVLGGIFSTPQMLETSCLQEEESLPMFHKRRGKLVHYSSSQEEKAEETTNDEQPLTFKQQNGHSQREEAMVHRMDRKHYEEKFPFSISHKEKLYANVNITEKKELNLEYDKCELAGDEISDVRFEEMEKECFTQHLGPEKPSLAQNEMTAHVEEEAQKLKPLNKAEFEIETEIKEVPCLPQRRNPSKRNDSETEPLSIEAHESNRPYTKETLDSYEVIKTEIMEMTKTMISEITTVPETPTRKTSKTFSDSFIFEGINQIIPEDHDEILPMIPPRKSSRASSVVNDSNDTVDLACPFATEINESLSKSISKTNYGFNAYDIPSNAAQVNESLEKEELHRVDPPSKRESEKTKPSKLGSLSKLSQSFSFEDEMPKTPARKTSRSSSIVSGDFDIKSYLFEDGTPFAPPRRKSRASSVTNEEIDSKGFLVEEGIPVAPPRQRSRASSVTSEDFRPKDIVDPSSLPIAPPRRRSRASSVTNEDFDLKDFLMGEGIPIAPPRERSRASSVASEDFNKKDMKDSSSQPIAPPRRRSRASSVTSEIINEDHLGNISKIDSKSFETEIAPLKYSDIEQKELSQMEDEIFLASHDAKKSDITSDLLQMAKVEMNQVSNRSSETLLGKESNLLLEKSNDRDEPVYGTPNKRNKKMSIKIKHDEVSATDPELERELRASGFPNQKVGKEEVPPPVPIKRFLEEDLQLVAMAEFSDELAESKREIINKIEDNEMPKPTSLPLDFEPKLPFGEIAYAEGATLRTADTIDEDVLNFETFSEMPDSNKAFVLDEGTVESSITEIIPEILVPKPTRQDDGKEAVPEMSGNEVLEVVSRDPRTSGRANGGTNKNDDIQIELNITASQPRESKEILAPFEILLMEDESRNLPLEEKASQKEPIQKKLNESKDSKIQPIPLNRESDNDFARSESMEKTISKVSEERLENVQSDKMSDEIRRMSPDILDNGKMITSLDIKSDSDSEASPHKVNEIISPLPKNKHSDNGLRRDNLSETSKDKNKYFPKNGETKGDMADNSIPLKIDSYSPKLGEPTLKDVEEKLRPLPDDFQEGAKLAFNAEEKLSRSEDEEINYIMPVQKTGTGIKVDNLGFPGGEIKEASRIEGTQANEFPLEMVNEMESSIFPINDNVTSKFENVKNEFENEVCDKSIENILDTPIEHSLDHFSEDIIFEKGKDESKTKREESMPFLKKNYDDIIPLDEVKESRDRGVFMDPTNIESEKRDNILVNKKCEDFNDDKSIKISDRVEKIPQNNKTNSELEQLAHLDADKKYDSIEIGKSLSEVEETFGDHLKKVLGCDVIPLELPDQIDMTDVNFTQSKKDKFYGENVKGLHESDAPIEKEAMLVPHSHKDEPPIPTKRRKSQLSRSSSKHEITKIDASDIDGKQKRDIAEAFDQLQEKTAFERAEIFKGNEDSHIPGDAIEIIGMKRNDDATSDKRENTGVSRKIGQGGRRVSEAEVYKDALDYLPPVPRRKKKANLARQPTEEEFVDALDILPGSYDFKKSESDANVAFKEDQKPLDSPKEKSESPKSDLSTRGDEEVMKVTPRKLVKKGSSDSLQQLSLDERLKVLNDETNLSIEGDAPRIKPRNKKQLSRTSSQAEGEFQSAFESLGYGEAGEKPKPPARRKTSLTRSSSKAEEEFKSLSFSNDGEVINDQITPKPMPRRKSHLSRSSSQAEVDFEKNVSMGEFKEKEIIGLDNSEVISKNDDMENKSQIEKEYKESKHDDENFKAKINEKDENFHEADILPKETGESSRLPTAQIQEEIIHKRTENFQEEIAIIELEKEGKVKDSNRKQFENKIDIEILEDFDKEKFFREVKEEASNNKDVIKNESKEEEMEFLKLHDSFRDSCVETINDKVEYPATEFEEIEKYVKQNDQKEKKGKSEATQIVSDNEEMLVKEEEKQDKELEFGGNITDIIIKPKRKKDKSKGIAVSVEKTINQEELKETAQPIDMALPKEKENLKDRKEKSKHDEKFKDQNAESDGGKEKEVKTPASEKLSTCLDQDEVNEFKSESKKDYLKGLSFAKESVSEKETQISDEDQTLQINNQHMENELTWSDNLLKEQSNIINQGGEIIEETKKKKDVFQNDETHPIVREKADLQSSDNLEKDNEYAQIKSQKLSKTQEFDLLTKKANELEQTMIKSDKKDETKFMKTEKDEKNADELLKTTTMSEIDKKELTSKEHDQSLLKIQISEEKSKATMDKETKERKLSGKEGDNTRTGFKTVDLKTIIVTDDEINIESNKKHEDATDSKSQEEKLGENGKVMQKNSLDLSKPIENLSDLKNTISDKSENIEKKISMKEKQQEILKELSEGETLTKLQKKCEEHKTTTLQKELKTPDDLYADKNLNKDEKKNDEKEMSSCKDEQKRMESLSKDDVSLILDQERDATKNSIQQKEKGFKSSKVEPSENENLFEIKEIIEEKIKASPPIHQTEAEVPSKYDQNIEDLKDHLGGKNASKKEEKGKKKSKDGLSVDENLTGDKDIGEEKMKIIIKEKEQVKSKALLKDEKPIKILEEKGVEEKNIQLKEKEHMATEDRIVETVTISEDNETDKDVALKISPKDVKQETSKESSKEENLSETQDKDDKGPIQPKRKGRKKSTDDLPKDKRIIEKEEKDKEEKKDLLKKSEKYPKELSNDEKTVRDFSKGENDIAVIQPKEKAYIESKDELVEDEKIFDDKIKITEDNKGMISKEQEKSKALVKEEKGVEEKTNKEDREILIHPIEKGRKKSIDKIPKDEKMIKEEKEKHETLTKGKADAEFPKGEKISKDDVKDENNKELFQEKEKTSRKYIEESPEIEIFTKNKEKREIEKITTSQTEIGQEETNKLANNGQKIKDFEKGDNAKELTQLKEKEHKKLVDELLKDEDLNEIKEMRDAEKRRRPSREKGKGKSDKLSKDEKLIQDQVESKDDRGAVQQKEKTREELKDELSKNENITGDKEKRKEEKKEIAAKDKEQEKSKGLAEDVKSTKAQEKGDNGENLFQKKEKEPMKSKEELPVEENLNEIDKRNEKDKSKISIKKIEQEKSKYLSKEGTVGKDEEKIDNSKVSIQPKENLKEELSKDENLKDNEAGDEMKKELHSKPKDQIIPKEESVKDENESKAKQKSEERMKEIQTTEQTLKKTKSGIKDKVKIEEEKVPDEKEAREEKTKFDGADLIEKDDSESKKAFDSQFPREQDCRKGDNKVEKDQENMSEPLQVPAEREDPNEKQITSKVLKKSGEERKEVPEIKPLGKQEKKKKDAKVPPGKEEVKKNGEPKKRVGIESSELNGTQKDINEERMKSVKAARRLSKSLPEFTKEGMLLKERAEQLFAEGRFPTMAKCEMAAKLLEMQFEPEDALRATRHCSAIYWAVKFLQQRCELCGGKYPVNLIASMVHCCHRACRECVKAHFTTQINDRSVLRLSCPHGCQPDLSLEKVALEYFDHLDFLLKQWLEPETHELFRAKLRNRALIPDHNFHWCSQCSSGYLAEPRMWKMTCPDCESATCSQCHRPWESDHEGRSCEAFCRSKFSKKPEVQLTRLITHLERIGIKCPNCGHFYHLAKVGSLYFYCGRCKHVFCPGCHQPYVRRNGLDRADHPRNCLFFQRYLSVPDLQQLLAANKVIYHSKYLDSLPLKPRCQIMEQKEKNGGFTDDICGRPTSRQHGGLCRSHYVEYLVGLVNQHSLDPVLAMDTRDVTFFLRQARHQVPEKYLGERNRAYKNRLLRILESEFPMAPLCSLYIPHFL